MKSSLAMTRHTQRWSGLLRYILVCAITFLLWACAGGSGGTSGTGVRSIIGTIVDVNRVGLPSVSITVVETGDMTITDATGAFTLESVEDVSEVLTFALRSDNLDTSFSTETPEQAAVVNVDVVVDEAANSVEEVTVRDVSPSPTPTSPPSSPIALSPTATPIDSPTSVPMTPTATLTPTVLPSVAPTAAPTATATSRPPCKGDFDNDGDIDSADQSLFLDHLGNGDASADLNEDGLVNTDDYIFFLSLLGSDC